MLGSDPIHQYDNGLGGNVQRVVSLEPVYEKGGGDSTWCDWYFNEFLSGACMAFAYAQTGQENSFTWKKMGDGYKIQIPLIAKLRDENKIRVETLVESGKWFKKNFKVTPPTSVTVLNDHSDKDLKTVWFNSRYYRANLLWEKGTLRFRDIHIFDENLESDYLTEKGITSDCNYYALPFVDGFQWSSIDDIAGLRFKTASNDSIIDIIGQDPSVDDSVKEQLTVRWPMPHNSGEIRIMFHESAVTITAEGKHLKNWFLELSSAEDKDLPFVLIDNKQISCKYEGFDYTVTSKSGTFARDVNTNLRVVPDTDGIILDFSTRK
jgi:hypothetical protein